MLFLMKITMQEFKMHLWKRNAVVNIMLQQYKATDPMTVTSPIGNELIRHRSFLEIVVFLLLPLKYCILVFH